MITLSVPAAFFISDRSVAYIRHHQIAPGSSVMSPVSTVDRNSAMQGTCVSAPPPKLTALWGIAPDGRMVSRWENQD
ncbi:MAG TPA: hypothetical protein PK677_16245 [Acidiphilium sp.]|nr:hypothetical protein [Acidiphilium sp.]HQU25297.1 hypothetical protein [Acidiphilium sp.]